MKFGLSLVGFCVAMGLGIMVMINGYGLEVKSWGWVIFGGAGSAIIGALRNRNVDS